MTKKSEEPVGRYVAETGYARGRRLKPPGELPAESPVLRGALAFEACEDGALIIYAARPAGREEHWQDGEPIRIEPDRVSVVLAACGDALAKKRSVR